MGGSLTVMAVAVAVAAGAGVDGWTDVSGPAAWEGTELADLARGGLPDPGTSLVNPVSGSITRIGRMLVDLASGRDGT